MCRNIKTLFNFEPPVTDEEIRAASLQFVRKVSGFNKPSKANEAAFLTAIDEVAAVSRNLLSSLETTAPARNWLYSVSRSAVAVWPVMSGMPKRLQSCRSCFRYWPITSTRLSR